VQCQGWCVSVKWHAGRELQKCVPHNSSQRHRCAALLPPDASSLAQQPGSTTLAQGTRTHSATAPVPAGVEQLPAQAASPAQATLAQAHPPWLQALVNPSPQEGQPTAFQAPSFQAPARQAPALVASSSAGEQLLEHTDLHGSCHGRRIL
jgi:hypothetical protein